MTWHRQRLGILSFFLPTPPRGVWAKKIVSHSVIHSSPEVGGGVSACNGQCLTVVGESGNNGSKVGDPVSQGVAGQRWFAEACTW